MQRPAELLMVQSCSSLMLVTGIGIYDPARLRRQKRTGIFIWVPDTTSTLPCTPTSVGHSTFHRAATGRASYRSRARVIVHCLSIFRSGGRTRILFALVNYGL